MMYIIFSNNIIINVETIFVAAEKGHIESMIDYSRLLIRKKDINEDDESEFIFLKKARNIIACRNLIKQFYSKQ